MFAAIYFSRADGMQNLKGGFERELLILRRDIEKFSARYPRAAVRLSLSGEQSDDMHVERLIQSAALLNAQVRERIEDRIPDFTGPLLNVLYPEFLRPVPACSIACFEPNVSASRAGTPSNIARGTPLTTHHGACGFRTVYDVWLSTVRIDSAKYQPATAAPSNVPVPNGTSGVFSIRFSSDSEMTAVPTERMRVFVDADGTIAAAVVDSLPYRAVRAFVEFDEDGRWRRLDAIPISSVGFDVNDVLIEHPDGRASQYRSLFEYFAFPEKFQFLDFDLARMVAGRKRWQSATLHVLVSGLPPETAAAAMLAALGSENFRLGCTPVINLFSSAAEPIALKDAARAVYSVIPQTLAQAPVPVWAIGTVRLTMENGSQTAEWDVKPFLSLEHRAESGSDVTSLYWTADCQDDIDLASPNSGCKLSFVDEGGTVTEPPRNGHIDVSLICSNGDFPSTMTWGEADGDFLYPDRSSVVKVTLLRKPTTSWRRAPDRDRHWHVIGSLSAGPFSLELSGVGALKLLVEGHLPAEARDAVRQSDAIKGISQESIMEWVADTPQSRMMRGLRIYIEVEEALLAGTALTTYARVLEGVFVRYVPLDSFIQLVLRSAGSGVELVRGRIVSGAIPRI
ncbi:MAG: type VI secretion system baseplate subunit TssF [Burkholderia gladioli]|uniref:type VI secretion system baseplate subunit TssF n=1 Tax=Burkholderia gladioli TaxID=28095 RepID=UPI001640BA0D|nr:type VI secretion system baseplate subunit TssF [Burkholderia gladioli]